MSDESAPRSFGFVQAEFPWPLGPDPGRYVLRSAHGTDPTAIVVVATLGAPERRMLKRRRARTAEPEPEPTPVATTRATVIPTAGAPADPARWFADLSPAQDEDEVDRCLAILNRVIAAHRVAMGDPYVREASRRHALVVRIGFGIGDQLAEGRWTQARELPPERRHERRVSALRPTERLAAILGGRDRPLACEELVLRARLDLEAARPREAALQLRVALEAAIAELEPDKADLGERIAELRELRGPVGAAANDALTGPLSPAAADAVSHALSRIEAALRARSAHGIRGADA